MSELKQYEMVRVRQLLKPLKEYDGWCINQRPPQIGDIGCIVEILQTPGVPTSYVVECCWKDGRTIWLGDFAAEELEALPENDVA